MLDTLSLIIGESWQLLGQMAPYLLFGFLVAGILSVGISPEWVERHLGGRGLAPVVKASIFGVPLPLCSCGVIPVSASIRRHGASRAATTAFLLSTPQTGVDSILVTYSLLGPVFAVFRPIVALLTGFLGGVLVRFFGEPNGEGSARSKERRPVCSGDGCADKDDKSVLLRILKYGFVTLPQDIGPALLIGILIAGVMAALVPAGYLQAYVGGGVLSILVMMAVGIPIYVCATASIPIAAGFLHMGASFGAVLAFLIAGPATNAATLTTVWKVLGKRTTALFVFTIAVSAVGFGLLLDRLVPIVEETLPQVATYAHAHAEGGLFYQSAAVVLLVILAFSFGSRFLREKRATKPQTENSKTKRSSQGQRLELAVTGMTCNHCVENVRRAVTECTGVQNVEVSLKRGRVVVEGENLDPDRIMSAIEELGYQARILKS